MDPNDKKNPRGKDGEAYGKSSVISIPASSIGGAASVTGAASSVGADQGSTIAGSHISQPVSVRSGVSMTTGSSSLLAEQGSMLAEGSLVGSVLDETKSDTGVSTILGGRGSLVSSLVGSAVTNLSSTPVASESPEYGRQLHLDTPIEGSMHLQSAHSRPDMTPGSSIMYSGVLTPRDDLVEGASPLSPLTRPSEPRPEPPRKKKKAVDYDKQRPPRPPPSMASSLRAQPSVVSEAMPSTLAEADTVTSVTGVPTALTDTAGSVSGFAVTDRSVTGISVATAPSAITGITAVTGALTSEATMSQSAASSLLGNELTEPSHVAMTASSAVTYTERPGETGSTAFFNETASQPARYSTASAIEAASAGDSMSARSVVSGMPSASYKTRLISGDSIELLGSAHTGHAAYMDGSAHPSIAYEQPQESAGSTVPSIAGGLSSISDASPAGMDVGSIADSTENLVPVPPVDSDPFLTEVKAEAATDAQAQAVVKDEPYGDLDAPRLEQLAKEYALLKMEGFEGVVAKLEPVTGFTTTETLRREKKADKRRREEDELALRKKKLQPIEDDDRVSVAGEELFTQVVMEGDADSAVGEILGDLSLDADVEDAKTEIAMALQRKPPTKGKVKRKEKKKEKEKEKESGPMPPPPFAAIRSASQVGTQQPVASQQPALTQLSPHVSQKEYRKTVQTLLHRQFPDSQKKIVDETHRMERKERAKKLMDQILDNIHTDTNFFLAQPHIPIQPRLIKPSLPLPSLTEYRPTQVELDWNKNTLRQIQWTGVHDINLVDPRCYEPPETKQPSASQIDPRDKALLSSTIPYDHKDTREIWKGKGKVPIFTVRPAYTEIGLRPSTRKTKKQEAEEKLTQTQDRRRTREDEPAKQRRFAAGIKKTFSTAESIDGQWLFVLIQVGSCLGLGLEGEDGRKRLLELNQNDVLREKFTLLRQQTLVLAAKCSEEGLNELDDTILSVTPGADLEELEANMKVPRIKGLDPFDELPDDWKQAWWDWGRLYADEMERAGLTLSARSEKLRSAHRQTVAKMLRSVHSQTPMSHGKKVRNELLHPTDRKANVVSVKEIHAEVPEIREDRSLVIVHFETSDPIPVDRLVDPDVDFFECEHLEQLRIRNNAPDKLYDNAIVAIRKGEVGKISAEYLLPAPGETTCRDPERQKEREAELDRAELLPLSWLSPEIGGERAGMTYDMINRYDGRLIHQREQTFVFRETSQKVFVSYPPRRLVLSLAPPSGEDDVEWTHLCRLAPEERGEKETGRKNAKYIFDWEEDLMRWAEEDRTEGRLDSYKRLRAEHVERVAKKRKAVPLVPSQAPSEPRLSPTAQPSAPPSAPPSRPGSPRAGPSDDKESMNGAMKTGEDLDIETPDPVAAAIEAAAAPEPDADDRQVPSATVADELEAAAEEFERKEHPAEEVDPITAAIEASTAPEVDPVAAAIEAASGDAAAEPEA